MSAAEWALAGVVGGWAVTQTILGLWAVRARRRAWEEYERRRDAICSPVRHPYPLDLEQRKAMVLRRIVAGRVTPEEAREHLCDGTISVNDYRAALAEREEMREMMQKG